MKQNHTISIVEAAKALSCVTGTIHNKLGIVPVTGKETVAVSKLVDAFKIPTEIMSDLLQGNDRALTRAQAASMLGIKTHCLNIVNRKRATILPVVNLGIGPGAGLRYSRRAVESHLALEQSLQ